MDLLIWWMRFVIAFVFAEAAIVHGRDPERVRIIMQDLGLPGLITTILIAADAAIALGLGVGATMAGIAATIYIAVATAAVGARLLRVGEVLDCGCGAAVTAVDARFFVRNSLYVLVIGLSWLQAPPAFAGSYWGALVLAVCWRAAPEIVAKLSQPQIASRDSEVEARLSRDRVG